MSESIQLFQAPDPALVSGASVTFEFGAQRGTTIHLVVTPDRDGWCWLDPTRRWPRPDIYPAMLFGLRPVKSIGMAPHQPRR